MREDLRLVNYKKRFELKSGHDTYSIYDPEKIFVSGYWDYMGVFPELNNSQEILLLGLGCGTIPRIIFSLFPNAKIDGVDNDAEIVETGRKYFAMRDKNLKIFISDGKEFLKNSKSAYDLILLDAFVELDIPQHLCNSDFFKLVKLHLSKKGVFSINVAKSEVAGEIASSLSAFFQNVYVLTAFNTLNAIVLASDYELDFSKLSRFVGLDDFEAKKF